MDKHKRSRKDTDHSAGGWGFLGEENYLRWKRTPPIFLLLLLLLLLQLCADFILLSFPSHIFHKED